MGFDLANDPVFEQFLAEVDRIARHWPLHRLDELDQQIVSDLEDMGLLNSPDEQSNSNVVDANGDPVYLAREGRNGPLSQYDRKGFWRAVGWAIRSEDLHDVSPVEGHPPFTLAIPWMAMVCDGSGASHEVTVTAWNGDNWITNGGVYPYLNAPIPMDRTIDDEWRV